MRFAAGRPFLTALAAAVCGMSASTALADVVNGTVSGGQPVQIKNGAGAVVAELKPGPFQVVLPVGQYTAVCGNGQPASPADFLSLSGPVTVNFSCGQ